MILFLCSIWQSFRYIGLMIREFANGPGDRGLISRWVIPKTQKWYLMSPCLTFNIIRWGWRVNGATPSPTLRCSSYWKGSLLVTLDEGYQVYLLILSTVMGAFYFCGFHVFFTFLRSLASSFFSLSCLISFPGLVFLFEFFTPIPILPSMFSPM